MDCGIYTYPHEFGPVLAGTIPLDIDIETSDLDIICEWKDKNVFMAIVTDRFKEFPGFSITEATLHNRDTVITGFSCGGFDMEIFGQNLPVKEQYAYRHLLIEHRVLLEKGESFRQQITGLKKQGYKTEPAFARLPGLESDDPYMALLRFEMNMNTDNV